MTPPCLIFAVGNPSRGDDALGPAFAARIERVLTRELTEGSVEVLTDFQLQVEHALDLENRRSVVFVDACVDLPEPWRFTRITPRRDLSISTHAVSPAAILSTFQQLLGTPPPSWILAIRGYSFELGEALSLEAQQGLDAAVPAFLRLLDGGFFDA